MPRFESSQGASCRQGIGDFSLFDVSDTAGSIDYVIEK